MSVIMQQILTNSCRPTSQDTTCGSGDPDVCAHRSNRWEARRVGRKRDVDCLITDAWRVACRCSQTPNCTDSLAHHSRSTCFNHLPLLHVNSPPQTIHMNSFRLHQVSSSTYSVILLRDCQAHGGANLRAKSAIVPQLTMRQLT